MKAIETDTNIQTTTSTSGGPDSLRDMSSGKLYRLDEIRYEGSPRRWIVVGDRPDCDLRIHGSSGHCLLLREHGRLFVEDDQLSGSALVNGIPVCGGLVEIRAGGLLTLGEITLIACGPDGIRQRVCIDIAEQKMRLADICSPGAHRGARRPGERRTQTRTFDRRRDGEPVRYLYELPGGTLWPLHEYLDPSNPTTPILLGASEDCDIVLDDEQVSARHCFVVYSEGQWHVYDNGSKNGVFLNMVELTPYNHAKLRTGYQLKIGTRKFVACGRMGREQTVDITAPSVPEYVRLSVGVYGKPGLAARFIRIARKTMWKWLRPHRPQRRIKGAS